MSGERSLSTPSASLVHPVSGGQFESGAVSGDKFNRPRITRIWRNYQTENCEGKSEIFSSLTAHRSSAHRLISLPAHPLTV